MIRVPWFTYAVAGLALAGATGCGAGENSPAKSSTATAARPSDAAGAVAHDFLSAVLSGDEARIAACLTPAAVQRLQESNKRFPSLGGGTTHFQIGEVRKPSETQALVQCLLSDQSPEGQPTRDELCCLMKLVDNQWRVSGIAFGTANGQPTILDFETAPRPMEAVVAPSPDTLDAAVPATTSRPSPPRTATETPPVMNR